MKSPAFSEDLMAMDIYNKAFSARIRQYMFNNKEVQKDTKTLMMDYRSELMTNVKGTVNKDQK